MRFHSGFSTSFPKTKFVLKCVNENKDLVNEAFQLGKFIEMKLSKSQNHQSVIEKTESKAKQHNTCIITEDELIV